MLVGQEVSASYDRSEKQDLIESAPSKDHENPFALCLRGEIQGQLAEAIGTLSEREQLVISLYYKEDLTMCRCGTSEPSRPDIGRQCGRGPCHCRSADNSRTSRISVASKFHSRKCQPKVGESRKMDQRHHESAPAL